MENNKLYINAFIMVFLLAGCYSKKNVYIETSEVDEPQQISNLDKWDSIYIDSIYKFVCQGKEFNIKGNTISRPYFDTNLRNCLLEMGYNGDKEANIQLAKLISMVGLNGMLIFGNSPKFRGPEVFEALLSIGEDYGPVYDFDQNLVPHLTKSSAFAYRYYRLIESIDGKSLTEYESKLVRAHKFKSKERLLPDYRINPEWQIEYDKLIYEGIKQAWEDGKIKLKPYEENY